MYISWIIYMSLIIGGIKSKLCVAFKTNKTLDIKLKLPKWEKKDKRQQQQQLKTAITKFVTRTWHRCNIAILRVNFFTHPLIKSIKFIFRARKRKQKSKPRINFQIYMCFKLVLWKHTFKHLYRVYNTKYIE